MVDNFYLKVSVKLEKIILFLSNFNIAFLHIYKHLTNH